MNFIYIEPLVVFDLKRVFTLTCCDGQTIFQVSPSLPLSSSNIGFYFICMFVKLQKMSKYSIP